MEINNGGKENKITLVDILSRAARAWLKYPLLTTLTVIAILVQQLFQTYFAYSLKLIIDSVLHKATNPPLTLVLGGLVVAFILMAIASFGGEQVNARACAYIFNDLRYRLYMRLQELSSNFYTDAETGDVLARFTGDLKAMEAGYTQAFLNVILISLGLLINIPYMFYLDWRLALLAVFLTPVLFLLVRKQLPGSMNAGVQLRQQEAETVNLVQETIRGQQTIKAFAIEPVLLTRFQEKLACLRETAIHSRFTIAAIGKTSSIYVLIVQLGVVLVGASLAFDGKISVGAFISFTAILNVIMKDVYEVAKKVIPSLIEAATGVLRIEALLLAPVTVEDVTQPLALQDFHDSIRFENVSFSYNNSQANIQNVSFEVRAGQSVVFVGNSGSGKSTLLNLLLRLYDPQSGRILFDGVNLRQLSQKSLRAQMSVVFQESYLFNTSIRENIRLGSPHASDFEIEEAAICAEVHDTILRFPNGYETLVGEAGVCLSGGQRQRIAIARAILSNPKILLLDEATSALDPAAEDAINKTLARLGQGRTVISVTHRLHAARAADKIFVMQHGFLVEQGSETQLLEARGVYYDLWQKQSGFEVSRDGRHARVDAERLRSISLFAGLSHKALAEIARHFYSEYYDAGQVVIHQGEEGNKAYLIVQGQVKVSAGNKHWFEYLEDGDYFGEMALLMEQPHSARVQTMTPCLFLVIYRDSLLFIKETHPEIARVLDQRLEIYQRNNTTVQALEL